MNITDLDPIKYDLLFERFLNPDRVSMPDIDIDIQDTRRGEVIDYVTEKYGAERVAQIITFGTMAARNSVRDTGRVLGMSYDEVDRIAKLVPMPVQGRHVPLAVSAGIQPGKGGEQTPDPELVKEYWYQPPRQNSHRSGHPPRGYDSLKRHSRRRCRDCARTGRKLCPAPARPKRRHLHAIRTPCGRRTRPAQNGFPGSV